MELSVETPQDFKLHAHDVFISRVRLHLNGCSGRPDWLDVGCGWHFDWPWEPAREAELVLGANVFGLDIDSDAIMRHRSIKNRTVGALERLAFRDSSFDVVTANVVMEHVRYPALVLSEIHRVLRPGGTLLFRTPSARNYIVWLARRVPRGPRVWLAGAIEGRKAEDVYPTYYRLNTSKTIAEICKIVGFSRLSVTVTKPRGALTRFPVLSVVERGIIHGLGLMEGNIIAEARK
jgi:2-polyprenyl-3-methyl-5-hydroxy-6-metoxy-1,4-benzoquinol methylase